MDNFSHHVTQIAFFSAVLVILAAMIQWAVNQWSEYFSFVPINFWQSISLCFLIFVALVCIRSIYRQEPD
jgi:ABC-type transport system involved in cytochrome c biogenesis permease subunit